MIIVNLMGGLGNQMFQYALGRRLAQDKGVALKLDTQWFGKQNLRKFELDKFNITFKIASEEEIYSTRHFFRNRIIRKVYSIYQNQLPYFKRSFINEPNFGFFDHHILEVPKNCYLTGYWQSEKYFSSMEDTIRKEFTLKEIADSNFIELSKEMQNINSVSLHVRRGDYVTNPQTNKFHGVLSTDYYKLAVKLIQNKIDTPHFYVFSDDLEWVKERLNFVTPCTYIEGKKEGRDCEEMWLMSQCKHHIIANSSFSWWGAWLGNNPDKIVISPNQWFADPNYKVPDLIPEKWIRI